MNLGIKHLSNNITPNTAGILWLTDDELNYKSPGVYEFNYLLNGILIKSLDNQTINDQKNHFFLGNNFGKPLFLGHAVIKSKEDIKNIYEHIKISENFINENSQIYIFNKSQNTANINVLKILSEKYKNIVFENLNI